MSGSDQEGRDRTGTGTTTTTLSTSSKEENGNNVQQENQATNQAKREKDQESLHSQNSQKSSKHSRGRSSKRRTISTSKRRSVSGSGGGRRSVSGSGTRRDDFVVNMPPDQDVNVNWNGGERGNATSHHRRTSFFTLQNGPPSRGSGSSTPGPYDFEGLADALTEHISSTQAQLQCSPYTLSFTDSIDEEFYTEFTVALRLRNWLWMGVFGILLIGCMQVLMAFTLTQSPSINELYLLIMVYFPLIAIVSFAYFANDMSAKYLPILSFLYVLVSGPVFIIGRAWIVETQSTVFALSPLYITILYCSSYFFELRYIYAVVISLISLGAWFSLAVVSWQWELSSSNSSDTMFEDKAYFIWSGVSIVFSMFFMCALSYTTEWNNRLQFLSNQQLIIFNSKLQKQLKGLEHTFTTTIADLESPLEKAIASIKLLLASPHITGTQIRILHEILVCLNSSHLMAPDLYHQVTSGEVVMDKEEEKWLFNELVRSQKESVSFLPNLAESDDSRESIPPNAVISSPVPGKDGSPTSSVVAGKSVLERIPIETLLTEEVASILEQVDSYTFPIFDFAEATQNRPLVVMAHTLMIESGIVDRLQIPPEKLMNFMYSVENGYRPELTFHNSIHAADVLHGIYHLCQLDKINGIFSDLETLSIYIAASIHDYDHPGVNNNFLIATRDKKALLYNDKSVLENHHCSSAFNLLLRPEHNFLESLDRKSFSTVRSSIVDMVLATDLAQHFDLLTRFKKKVVTAGTFDPFGSPDDKSILMQMLMKCSDVSNPTKEWPIYQEWIHRILQEFYNQGDLEKKMGLPVSPFMNRDSPGPSAQKGFIEYIVYPLFEALESWTEIHEIKRNLDASRDRFCSATTDGAPASTKKHRKSLRPIRMDLTPSSTSQGDNMAVRSANDSNTMRKIKYTGDTSRRASAAPVFRTTPSFFQSRSHSTVGLLNISNVLSQSKSVDSGLPLTIPVPEESGEDFPAGGHIASKDADPFTKP